MIREIIIVEGKDDISRVKASVDADVVATGGIHISKRKLDEIVEMTKDRGAIILTDPDHPGELIRKKLKDRLKGPIKEAFISQGEALYKGDVGIENADPDTIRRAIENARPLKLKATKNFDSDFLFQYGFTGQVESSRLREEVSKILGIGKPNAKEFIKRLNSYGIEKEKVLEAIEEVRKKGALDD